MKKLISIFAAFILILAGCGNGGNSNEQIENVSDEVLTIWGFYEGAPKVAMDYYAEQTGKEVVYQTIGWDDYQTKLNTVLGTNDAPDLLMLERSFMGSYLGTENILSMEALMADEEQFATYKENTALATMGPGTVGEEVKAIGWENTAAAYFYRTDLASQCLGINSVEEMEAATKTFDGYTELHSKLSTSSDAACKGMSMFGFPDYRDGFLTEAEAYKFQEDGSYVITKEYGEALETLKTIVDSGMVYSPDGDKTQITSANFDNKILGNLSPAWGTQLILEYEQPGLWAVADSPLDFTAGGTYLAATPTADTEMVKEFLNMTFLNEEWLVNNMDTFGMVGNETVMNQYLETTSAENPYFGGQNTVAKFAEINDSITDYNPVSVYDAGLGTSLEEVYQGYVVDGTIKSTDDAKQQLKDKLASLYPELEVTIE
ncbi:extracellular solute-binding protein [Mollicutes bacterium LVI A0039]|nr:extracellular solute-binding protein [Mollicutes bacterium LVI A0039]